MSIDHPDELAALRAAGRVVAETLRELAPAQPPRPRDPVHRLVVDADADGAGEAVDERGRRAGAVAGEDLRGERVELGGRDAGAHAPRHLAQRRGHGAPGTAQPGELLGGVGRHGATLTPVDSVPAAAA